MEREEELGVEKVFELSNVTESISVQKVDTAVKVLNERSASLILEMDGLKSLRQEIDNKYLQFSEKLDPQLQAKNSLATAKIQWKIDIIQHRAKITDNRLLKTALTYHLVASRLEKLNKMPKDAEIKQIEGSDIFTALSIDENICKIDEENATLTAEIMRIEESNSRSKKQIDAANEDLVQANHLLEASKEMEKRGNQGYNEIEKIIRNPSTKLGYNINKYVNSYLEGAADLPAVWDFIYAIRDQLLKTVPGVTEEQAESTLENFILPILHNKMMSDLDLKERDDFVLAQCKKYSYTTQDQFNINPDFKDHSLVPYVKAIAELRSIYFQFSPTKKMSAILRAASAVYEITGQLQPKITMGGDDFIDIWVYVVLHSQLRNLPSTSQYISQFASEDLMTSEMGYYFTSVEVALNFIEKLTDEKLKISPSAQITSRPFIVPEKERYRVFCSVDKNIDLAKDNVTLSGFKLYAIENWVLQPGRFYASFLQRTKDPKDQVTIAILKSNDNISPAQQTFIHDTFFRDKPDENLKVEETMHGSVLCSTQPPNDSLGPHILLATGDYDKEINTVKMIGNLKAFKYQEITSIPPYITEEHKETFFSQFALVQQKNDFAGVVVQLVKDVQIALKHLNYFPYLCVIDGIMSSVLIKSLEIFQKQYNESTEIRYDGQQTFASTMNFHGSWANEERPSRLPSDGSLTPETWNCIRYRVNNLKNALQDLGFDGVDDPIRQYIRFIELIKQFQESIGMMPDGILSQKTVQALIAKWHEFDQRNDLKKSEIL